MMRILRAFFAALWLTLRGKSAPRPVKTPAEFEPLLAWQTHAQHLLAAVYAAADAAQLDKSARQKIVARVEGRSMSLETALATLHHHLAQEYPYLLNNLTAGSLTAIAASNLNDRYYLAQISMVAGIPTAVVTALNVLMVHLEALPSAQPSAPVS